MARWRAGPKGQAEQKNRVTDPVKKSARKKVLYAVKTGKLVKPDSCGKCGKGGPIQAHHPDYSQPLNVEWLCGTCHANT